MKLPLVLLPLAIATQVPAFGQSQSTAKPIPHLERRGAATQLIVDGNPFLVLGGEVRNSSASSLSYMKPIWPRLAGMGLNTALAGFVGVD